MDDDILIDTRYGPKTLTDIMAWPVLVCPRCKREHAHPPRAMAAYWPECWECWSKWAAGAE